MEKILNLYKQKGETPLQCIERFQKENLNYQGTPLTYAGRLDPLAEGVLLVLVEEECKKKDQYLRLSKEYTADMVFGFESDTYDILGIPTAIPMKNKEVRYPTILSLITNLVGAHEEPYPPYSSKAVKGKALWQWAREGRLDEVDVPTHTVVVTSATIDKWYQFDKEELWSHIKEAVSLISGDFRQKEVLERWQYLIWHSDQDVFRAIRLSISCESGTYIRSIVNTLGENSTCGAVLTALVRNKVGYYEIKDSV